MLSRTNNDFMQHDDWPLDNLYETFSADQSHDFSADSSCLGYTTLDAHDLYSALLEEKPSMEDKVEYLAADRLDLDFETSDNALIDPESSVNLQPFLGFGPDLGASVLEDYDEPCVSSTTAGNLQRISIIIHPDGKLFCTGDLTSALATLPANWVTQIDDNIPDTIEEESRTGKSDSCSRKAERPSKLRVRQPSGATIDKESEEYRLRRERNNISVRQSRAKARHNQKEIEKKVQLLTTENQRLSDKVDSLTKELNILRGLFGNVGESLPHEVTQFFDS